MKRLGFFLGVLVLLAVQSSFAQESKSELRADSLDVPSGAMLERGLGQYETTGVAGLPDGGTLRWRERVSDAAVEQVTRFYDRAGTLEGSLSLAARMGASGSVLDVRIRFEDAEVVIDPEDGASGTRLKEFLESARLSDLPYLIDQALPVLPSDCALRKTLAAIGEGLEPSTLAVVPSSDWDDCYVECVIDERTRCQNVCGTRNAINPCLSICYVSISIGCSVGCTEW